MIQVLWYKRDIRIYDHQPLVEALSEGPVIALYLFEPSIWSQSDLSIRHEQFVRESLDHLATSYHKRQASIFFVCDEIIPLLERIYTYGGAFQLWSHQENGTETTYARDRLVKIWMNEHGLKWQERRHFGVFRGLKYHHRFGTLWETHMNTPIFPAPTRIFQPEHLDQWSSVVHHQSLDTIPFQAKHGSHIHEGQLGGEKYAHHLLTDFLQRRSRKYQFHLSKPEASRESCSRLSPYLAWGNVSIRYVLQQTQSMIEQSDDKHRLHLEAFATRLRWHCHFIQRLEHHPMMHLHPLNESFDQLRTTWDKNKYEKWLYGQTGFPLIDASMRALRHTGYLNFRSRSMLLSFICHSLWLDWRKPGMDLAQLFLDYEPGIHWNQVQMQSAVTGFHTIRIYHPGKQIMDHDPDGHFIRKWLPELIHLPNEHLSDPWSSGIKLQYPHPIIDIHEANEFARTQLWAMKGSNQTPRERQKKRKTPHPIMDEGFEQLSFEW